MITNFEEITNDLTEEELALIPYIIKGFKNYTKENPINAPEIIERLNTFLKSKGYKIKMTQPRLRKFVNHIRTNSLLPVIATSKGYYVSYDEEDINNQIKSLIDRANSIISCANGLNKFIKD